jgi:hypothetical protein
VLGEPCLHFKIIVLTKTVTCTQENRNLYRRLVARLI